MIFFSVTRIFNAFLIFDSDLISLFDVGILPPLVRAILKTSLAIRGSEYCWFSFLRKLSILSAYLAAII
jgi:hypothetical protein